MIRRLRFWLGRQLMHLGLKALPPGRARDELYAINGAWGRHVIATLQAYRCPPDAEKGAE